MKLNSSFKEINQSPLHKLFTACKGQLVLLVLRVSFTLFNLQGTQRVALNHRCYILAHLVSLVKYFFQNFSAPALSFKPFALARNSFILPRSFELVKNFFRASQPLSGPQSRFPSSFSQVPSAQANLFSLPRSRSFVKHFFQLQPESPSGFRPVSSSSCRFFRARLTGAQI